MGEARVVVDEIQKWPTKIACFKAGSCHLMIEHDEHGQLDLERLHAFAESIGLQRGWFQAGSMPHYDLTPSKRKLALAMGAVFVPWREQAKARLVARGKWATIARLAAEACATEGTGGR
ncbi:MAG TPA: DUF4031 domain-containing protein [Usitatibacter sp.]|nr:DUF4031 domain-containing protein [Usitatibacter sp.]